MSAAPHEISPADRTVGQLVADTIRFYGSRFLPSVALGLVVAVFNQVAIGSSRDAQGTLLLLASPFFTLGYIGACVLVLGRRPTPRAFLIALVIGICAFLPVGILVWFFVLPALAWLAYAGLTVPAVLDDDLGPRDALNRARPRDARDARRRLLPQPLGAALPPARAGGRNPPDGRVPGRPRPLADHLPGLGTAVSRPEGPVRVGRSTTKETRCPSTSC